MKTVVISLLLLLARQNLAAENDTSSTPPSAEPDSASNEIETYIAVPDIRNVNEALMYFNSSVVNQDRIVYTAATTFLEKEFTGVLRSALIATLHPLAILDLIRHRWIVEEIEVFYAVSGWSYANPNADKFFVDELLRNVQLVTMNPDQLRDIVYPSGLYDPQQIIDALTIKAWDLDDNGYERFPNQLAESNVLVNSIGVTALTDECPDDFFSDDNSLPKFCSMKANTEDGLILRTDVGLTLNTIEIVIHYRPVDVLTVQVSGERIRWVTAGVILDANGGHVIRFSPQSIRYIRIHGANKTNQTILLTKLQAYYSTCY